jgi:hypothetical protein
LFYDGDDASCRGEEWSSWPVEERRARRQAYARAAAQDVKARADGLAGAWSDAFMDSLRNAGENATYPTLDVAMNQVTEALFALEAQVKDGKLGQPLGYKNACVSPPCLDRLESQYARHNSANLRENLVGFRRLVEGCEANYTGYGLDDLVTAKGGASLATRLNSALRDVQTALDAMAEPDLSEAMRADVGSVQALYDSVKAVTDLLKSETVMTLDLRLPAALEGDND